MTATGIKEKPMKLAHITVGIHYNRKGDKKTLVLKFVNNSTETYLS